MSIIAIAAAAHFGKNLEFFGYLVEVAMTLMEVVVVIDNFGFGFLVVFE